MNGFISVLEKHEIDRNVLTRNQLTTLQVNMGDLCNQVCHHCHVGASPSGKNNMTKKVVDDILKFLSENRMKTLDITGGAPEMNPHFDYLVTSARPLVEEIIVRSNLTVFFEKGREYLPQFFKDNQIHLICSLPCYTEQNVDKQRGKGVFNKSIKALNMLNKVGFAKDARLKLDLVYNPAGAYLPGPQCQLEHDYKKMLKKDHAIDFDRLLTITNVAIKKFKEYLQDNDEHDRYYELLQDNFNPKTLENLMCRSFLSVGYDGKLYDCDFNLALGIALKNKNGSYMTIDKLRLSDLDNREIITGEHCLSCTAGSGSSCQGALTEGEEVTEVVAEDKKEVVKEYYGKVLRTKEDLKTSACCALDAMPQEHREILKMIEPEILEKFYGCGSPIPPSIEGCTVLDLGAGTGRDVYLVSKFVGENGMALGIDMTDEQLSVARKYQDSQMKKFGYKKCNVDFKKGFIEDLKSCGIEDNSVDVVISNCVINLSPDKRSVFSEIFRVLKPGGELYFADVFAGARVPENVKDDPVLYGECLGGALYIEDFRRMLRDLGCMDYRVVTKRKIDIERPELQEAIGNIEFCSMTIRAFKLDLEDICEDYGQVATYLGNMQGQPHQFVLDDHHVFKTGKPMLVCGNTAAMVQDTRFGRYFRLDGDKSVHYGPFPCGPAAQESEGIDGACC